MIDKILLEKLKSNYNKDWLLPLEMYELVYNSNSEIEQELVKYLANIKKNEQHTALINNGLKLIYQNN